MIELIETLPAAVARLTETYAKGGPGTAASAGEEPELKFVLRDVRVSLSSGELQYEGADSHETFARLGTELHNTSGTLYLTSSAIVWFNEATRLGLTYPYTAVVLHAVSGDHGLFMQVEAGEVLLPDGTKLHEEDYELAGGEEDMEDCLAWDVTMGVGSAAVAQAIYATISSLSASLEV